MNRKEFEDALMATIVEYISDQVILRYAQACKKATVLFSGALIGYKDAVTSLNELKLINLYFGNKLFTIIIKHSRKWWC